MAIQKITAKIIADGAIIAADVADGSITNAKIASVANTKITGLITSAQIANVANTQVTGNPLFSAGSNTAPALTTSGDTNTGIFFPTADTIAFAEGGVESMRLDSSGNVGIGTTSPSVKLDVNGTGKFGTQTTGAGLIQGSSDTFQVGLNINNSSTTNAQIWSEYVTGATTKTFAIRSRVANDTGTAQTQLFIDSSGYVTNAVNGLGNGIVQAQQYYRLNSTVAGANATGAQSIFGVGVTLVGSTQYEFEVVYMLAKTAGITSHTVSVGFGGTATLNNIGYFAVGTDNSAAISGRGGGTSGGFISSITASAVVFTAAIANATSTVSHIIKGTVSVNAGGTFIPQYTLSAAPGGAYTTQAGSYIKIAPLSASGSNTSIGTWA